MTVRLEPVQFYGETRFRFRTNGHCESVDMRCHSYPDGKRFCKCDCLPCHEAEFGPLPSKES